MTKYIITGATGLIGGAVARELVKDAGNELILPVRDIDKASSLFGQNDNVFFVEHDFATNNALEITGDVDYVIHCACPTESRFMKEHPVETIDTIVNGTRTMLDLAKEKAAKGIVYVSSLEVYGTTHDDSKAITEDMQGYVDPMAARSSYPMGKRMAEAMCHAYAAEYDVPVSIARLTQTFGPGVDMQKDNRVFAQFARSAKEDKDIVLHTLGGSKKPYLHTYDAVSAITVLLKNGSKGVAYNVANEDTYISIKEMAEFVRETYNTDIAVRIELKDDGVYPPETHLRLDTTAIRSLGWRPLHGLKDMFDAII